MVYRSMKHTAINYKSVFTLTMFLANIIFREWATLQFYYVLLARKISRLPPGGPGRRSTVKPTA